MRAAILLASVLALGACGGPSGSFPSLQPRPGETPRAIPAAGSAPARGLSDEERAALDADLSREVKALAAARRGIGDEGKRLDGALKAAAKAEPGSNPWVEAQMALSRYDAARAVLSDIDARLAAVRMTVETLPPDPAVRQRLDALSAALSALIDSTAATADAAGRRLGS
jgi:hypothetical protein